MSNSEILPTRSRRANRSRSAAAHWCCGCLYSLLITHHAFASPGIVQTLDTRHSGNLRLTDQHIQVDNKTVAWSSALYVLLNIDRQPANADEVIWLKNGERWHVNLLGMTSQGLNVRSRIIGKRTLSLDLIHRIDFLPNVSIRQPEEATLYRPDAEAIPGNLLWIDRTHLAIDSTLGVAKTLRTEVSSYVFALLNATPPASISHIGLIDGSVFAGALKFGNEGVALNHGVLGELIVPFGAIRSIKPASTNIQFLTDIQPDQTDSTSPLNTPMDPAAPVWSNGSTTPITQHFNHLPIPAGTTIHYPLPSNKNLRFRAHLTPDPHSQGDTHLIVAVDSKVILNKTIRTQEEPLVLDIPKGNQISLQATFGEHLRFPSSITIADPILIVQ